MTEQKDDLAAVCEKKPIIFPLWYSSEDNAIYDDENNWIADVDYSDRPQLETNAIGELLVQRANDAGPIY